MYNYVQLKQLNFLKNKFKLQLNDYYGFGLGVSCFLHFLLIHPKRSNVCVLVSLLFHSTHFNQRFCHQKIPTFGRFSGV